MNPECAFFFNSVLLLLVLLKLSLESTEKIFSS